MSIDGYSVGDRVKVTRGPCAGNLGVIIGPSSSIIYPVTVQVEGAGCPLTLNYHFNELTPAGSPGGAGEGK